MHRIKASKLRSLREALRTLGDASLPAEFERYPAPALEDRSADASVITRL